MKRKIIIPCILIKKECYLCALIECTVMKKSLLIFLSLLSCMGLTAQEYHEEYRIFVGDTILWTPFAECGNINYKVSSKEVVQFQPLHLGEKVQVIGLKPGICYLKAICADVTVAADIIVNAVGIMESPSMTLEKPATLPFTGTYQFNPPTDHFFITVANPDTEYRETHAKIGDEEAYNNGNEIDRFWNITTGANYFYVPDAQGWTDDVKFDFEPFGESFYPLNTFAYEVNTDEDLSPYYIGTEKVLDVDCWVFFVELGEGNVVRYWVDPSNGCTLKRIVNTNGPSEVTVYDLNYTRWVFGPHYKKSLHDKTR